MGKTTYAGINHQVILDHFTSKEREIIHKTLSKQFYITNGGTTLSIGKSTYRYCFLKFPDDKIQLWGITSEIIVLFSPFQNFEPRSLDAFDRIYEEHSGYRLDKICVFVISEDRGLLEKLEGIVKSNKESRVIAPFTYDELESQRDLAFFRKRIEKFFFERDLFDVDSALKKDLYFFGREQLCHKLVDKLSFPR